MNRKIVIETIKRELSITHNGVKVVHNRSEKDKIDLFTLIHEKIYLTIPVFDMDKIIDTHDNPIHIIMIDILFRLMDFMKNISNNS